MTTSIIQNLQNSYNVSQPQDNSSAQCRLQWRRKQLLVKPEGQFKQLYLPAVDNAQRLVECLSKSPVELVRIDPKIGVAKLRCWADACEEANKTAFLRIPSAAKIAAERSQFIKWLKRVIDWSLALLLLVVATPLMLALGLMIYTYSPGKLFCSEWHVGERGKLFRVFKFHIPEENLEIIDENGLTYHIGTSDTTDEQYATLLGRWMQKYSLEHLPQLFNVLRGEMTLVGSRPYNLSDAVRLSPKAQRQLNIQPGFIGVWQASQEQTDWLWM